MISRPDACFAIGLLLRCVANPTDEHYNAVLWLIDYLVGTLNLGMCYKGGNATNDLKFARYVDAS